MSIYSETILMAIQLAEANGDTEVAYDLMFRDPDISAEMERDDLTACEMLERIKAA